MTPIERAARALEQAGQCSICGTLCGGCLTCDCEWAEWEPANSANRIRAVLQAIREPDGNVMQAGNRVWLDGGTERQIFEAMIDAALEEG